MTVLRRILVVVILAATSLAFASARPAWACSCAQIDYLANAKTAFVGVATEVDGPSGDNRMTIRFDVEKVQKGDPGREVELTTHKDGGTCGYEFVKGHRYQVFADDGTTNLCAGNEDLGVVAATSAPAGAPAPKAAPKSADFSTGLWITAGAVLVVGALGAFLYRRRRENQ